MWKPTTILRPTQLASREPQNSHLGIHPFKNVTGSQVESWRRVTIPKVWVRLFRSKYKTNSLVTINKTCALLKNLVWVESNVALGVSFPLQYHTIESEHFPPPYHMMISSLINTQIKHLINLEIVSTKDINSFLTDNNHIKLIQLIRTCTFPSAMAGFGLPLLGKDILLWANCKLIDHNTLNCLFPDLPGWLGYKPMQSQPSQMMQSTYNNNTNHLSKNHCRGRGSGRGRGGGIFRGGRLYGCQAFCSQWN